MEGWDGTTDGRPSDLTMRRWRHFGASGAKLIWGGEAVAVCPEGRANPNQLVISDHTKSDLANLLIALAEEHESAFGAGATKDLCVGLQLTHSGRFARPSADGPAPLVAYEHPVLDKRSGAAVRLLLDSDLDRLVEQFVEAARHAADIGFQFVDIKHCHGYLLHELLSARSRRGKYGGDSGESHAVPARHHRRHPRLGACARDWRPAVDLRHRAVSQRSGRPRRTRGPRGGILPRALV